MATDTPFDRMNHADRIWLSERRERIRHLIGSIYDTLKDKRILDVGMGRWSLVKNVFPEFYVVGIDVVSPSSPPDEFCFADAHESLPFEDGEFALVFAGEIMEHLGRESARYLLEEISRVLLAEGYLLLTTPNGSRNMLKVILGRPKVEAHLEEISFRGINSLLSETGFRIVHSEGIQPFFIPWGWSDRLAQLKLPGPISSQLIYLCSKRKIKS